MSSESPDARLERLDRLEAAVLAMGDRFKIPRRLDGELGVATSLRVLGLLGEMLQARGEVLQKIANTARDRGERIDELEEEVARSAHWLLRVAGEW